MTCPSGKCAAHESGLMVEMNRSSIFMCKFCGELSGLLLHVWEGLGRCKLVGHMLILCNVCSLKVLIIFTLYLAEVAATCGTSLNVSLS